MKERVANQRSNFGLPEMTCTRARVEIPLYASRGQYRYPSSFVRGEIAAQLRCGPQNVSFLEFNAIENHPRQGITQSKCEEVRAGFLFPVRKPPAVADDNFAKRGRDAPETAGGTPALPSGINSPVRSDAATGTSFCSLVTAVSLSRSGFPGVSFSAALSQSIPKKFVLVTTTQTDRSAGVSPAVARASCPRTLLLRETYLLEHLRMRTLLERLHPVFISLRKCLQIQLAETRRHRIRH